VGGRLARLGSEFFPNGSIPGWVQATSSVAGLQGFWLGGDFVNYGDGAEAASAAPDQILPLVTSQTEVNITNINTGSITVSIRLFGNDGIELASAITRTIAGRGAFQEQVSVLLPAVNLSQAGYIRLTSTGASAATSVVSGFLASPSSAVINGIDASSRATELDFPQASSGQTGGFNFVTAVAVTNLIATPQNVTITFTP